ncbi:MAG TPA: late competence development ComFB family protein [Syntrophomonadaceae bacterium]|nr:late competence development ComFB family protein [Syntrophomonadaceae bacterium]
MKVINVVESLVWNKLDEVLLHKPEMCQCDKCRADIAAYALNHLPPRYVVSDEGEIYARAESLGLGSNASLVVAITEAIEIVAKNPKHIRSKNE